MAITQVKGAQVLNATITEDDLNASVAGVGISGGAGTALALDLNELSAVVVDVAADFIAIEDATDNSTKKEAIADIITATAGDGLGATSGVLAVNVDDTTIETNADALRVKALGIDTAQLAVDAVDGTKIADDSVDSEHYVAASIDNEHIADGAVDTQELAADAVDGTRIADAAVDSEHIASGAVDVNHLSDLRVTEGTALVADYAAGTLRNDNAIVSISAATVAVADDDVSYVEVDSAGSVTSNTTGFTAGRVPLAEVTAATGDITVVTDKRAWLDIEIGASGLVDADFVIREVPTGDLDGVDVTYTLANTPTAATEEVYLNGVLQNVGGGNDYTISGATITFAAAPVSTDVVLASYRK